ncbi:MAG: hypothetical protein VYE68_16730 [Acidobacteriota bacterium]|nr:hypothetical protein [Acidobacteriota bacterium]
MARSGGVVRLVISVVALVVMFCLGWVVAKTGTGEAVPTSDLSALERDFTERMQDVTMVGHFTIEGRETRGGSPERYEIASVTKVGQDQWRFEVRMVYASVDVTLPVVVPMVWAGDTPMVSITDFSIPGLEGTFTSRVFFYTDRYAGSWQHGQYGGLMYGHIEGMD